MTSKSAITPSFRGRTAWMWRRRAADHPLGLGAHGKDGSSKGVDRDDGRLVQHDAAATHVDERVRGAEVDGHVATKEPEYPLRPLGRSGRGGRGSLNPLGHGIRRSSQQEWHSPLATSRGRNHVRVTTPGRLDRLRCRPSGGVRMSFAVVFPGRDRSSPAWPTRGSRTRPRRRCSTRPPTRCGRDLVAGCHDEAALATTEFVQPALLACDVAAFRVLEAEGADGGRSGRGGPLARRVRRAGRRRRAGSRPTRCELVVVRGARDAARRARCGRAR